MENCKPQKAKKLCEKALVAQKLTTDTGLAYLNSKYCVAVDITVSCDFPQTNASS